MGKGTAVCVEDLKFLLPADNEVGCFAGLFRNGLDFFFSFIDVGANCH